MKNEKYFIVTEGSPLYKAFKEYQENLELVNEHVKKFMKKHGIKTSEYSASNETFYIVPVREDKEKFENSLGKELGNGLRPFKKNSKIGKDWVNSLKSKNLKVIRKPMVALYFETCAGRHWSRLFELNGVVYCTFALENGNPNVPKGMIEIKASEFFKIIEEAETKSA